MNKLTPDYKKLIGSFAFLAVILFVGLTHLFPEKDWLSSAKLAALSIAPLLYIAYINILWRIPMARIGGFLCDMPDLNGRWEGVVDRKDARGPHAHVIEIRQTLISISMRNFGDKSGSRSTSASINYHSDDKTDCILVYTFQGETKNDRKGKEVKKRTVVVTGETRLSLVKRINPVPPNTKIPFLRFFAFPPSDYDLIGDYSSNRTDTADKVLGEINVKWVQHKRKGRFQ